MKSIDGSIDPSFVQVDLSDHASVRKAAAEILQAALSINVLINSAGNMAIKEYLYTLDKQDIKGARVVNLTSGGPTSSAPCASTATTPPPAPRTSVGQDGQYGPRLRLGGAAAQDVGAGRPRRRSSRPSIRGCPPGCRRTCRTGGSRGATSLPVAMAIAEREARGPGVQVLTSGRVPVLYGAYVYTW
ncbi:hypothetical protein LQW54_000574 [Pestalotiopsis sp. IQ-011]